MKAINFFLDKTAHVILSIKHVSDFGIAILLSETLEPGEHSVPLTDPIRLYSGKILKYELVVDGQLKEWNLFPVA